MLHTPPRAHPSDDVLLEYAAGTLPEATALLVATHLALCPDCREQVRTYEAVGGALLEQDTAVADADHLLDACLAALDNDSHFDRDPPPRYCAYGVIPRPLLDYLPAAETGLDRLWTQRARGLQEIRIPTECGLTTKLMRISAGQPMPRHRHGGREFTLVLAGGFSDDRGAYRRGDVALAAPGEIHQPVAHDDADCVCLAVVEGRLALTGPVGRLLNLFVRF